MISPNASTPIPAQESKIAIVGMSCLFPGAGDLSSFWKNIVSGKDSIREVTPAEWDEARYFDPSSSSFDRVYCKRGGFITELAHFDPLKHGIMPNAVRGADADQFLALRVATEAIRDAGYDEREISGLRAEVILGRTSAPGAGAMTMIQQGQTVDQFMDAIAAVRPDYDAEQLNAIREQIVKQLPPCNADTIPGVMPNVMAGRIASRLGITGRSLLVDSACASSLIAVETGMRDLLAGTCDLALAGGVHINSFACFYQMFCGLGALSASGQISPFDSSADGTLLGEGLGIVVLKRLEDAQRDGNRIYAVIAGIGTSSDGYGSSILAPSVEGEALALQRAYDMAGVSPRTVQLLEAHGTGTPVGDLVEMQAIRKVFLAEEENSTDDTAAGQSVDTSPWCALGTVKSMIGHTQAASGIAGLIKAALSLYHSILPPSLNVTEPAKEIDWSTSPCYVNNRTRPWIHPSFEEQQAHPRRAAVSAFGFGGVNAHAVLEEHGDSNLRESKTLLKEWDSEICIFQADSNTELKAQLQRLHAYLERSPNVALKDIAWSNNCRTQIESANKRPHRLAIVASSTADLGDKLRSAEKLLLSGTEQHSQNGIFLSSNGNTAEGKVAFLLPGLGAAYPNMLADLCIHFPEVREVFDFVDLIAQQSGDSTLPSRMVFPSQFLPSSTSGSDALALASAHSAVVLVLMAEWAMYTLLSNLGVKPDTVMGCSTGEFAALSMNGSVDIVVAAGLFYKLSAQVSRSIPAEELQALRSLKVSASADSLALLWKRLNERLYLSADLGPTHAIVSGSTSAIEAAAELLESEKIEFIRLPFAIPYHTPLVSGKVDKQQQELLELPITSPTLKSWSCSLAAQYPLDVKEIREISTGLFEKPIQLTKTIEAMYEDGVRTFLEVGPKGNLTALIADILSDRPHLALASNLPGVPSITQIQHVLATLFCQGTDLQLEYLYRRRDPLTLNFEEPVIEGTQPTGAMLLDLSYPEIRLKHVPEFELPLPTGAPIPHSEEMVPAADDGADDVMSQYFKTMSDFHARLMEVEQRVVTEYLNSSSRTTDSAELPAPFLRGATIETLADRAVVQRTFSLQEDLYLLDHAIGGVVRGQDESSSRVYLVPLMVTLEIMAEAASLLEPALPLTRMENIRAYRRIRVDEAGVGLNVIAIRKPENEHTVSVEVRKASSLQSRQAESADDLLASCDIIFDFEYPQAPQAESINFEDAVPSRFRQADLYSSQAMFHGPRMQSVIELSRVGKRAIAGNVLSRRPEGWFASDPECALSRSFLIDPLLLDNSSQLVLFHLFEHGLPVQALLPFHIESIEFFSSPQPLNAPVSARAQLPAITNESTHANVEILRDYGNNELRKWICINGITSRRITVPEKVAQFIGSPNSLTLSDEMPQVALSLNDPERWICTNLDGQYLPEDRTLLDWFSDYVLSPLEQDYFLTELRSDKRKREWLMGRIAAKDALRSLLKRQCGIDSCPADIDLLPAASGRPSLAVNLQSSVTWTPFVSISHKDGVAIAIAGRPAGETGVGIDIEDLRPLPDGFDRMSFTASELATLQNLPDDRRSSSVLRLWCAREALGKALGLGLAEQLKHIQIRAFDESPGKVILSLTNYSSGPGKPALDDAFVVHTFLSPQHVVAVTTCERSITC